MKKDYKADIDAASDAAGYVFFEKLKANLRGLKGFKVKMNNKKLSPKEIKLIERNFKRAGVEYDDIDILISFLKDETIDEILREERDFDAGIIKKRRRTMMLRRKHGIEILEGF